jgi:hypothetical protein
MRIEGTPAFDNFDDGQIPGIPTFGPSSTAIDPEALDECERQADLSEDRDEFDDEI